MRSLKYHIESGWICYPLPLLPANFRGVGALLSLCCLLVSSIFLPRVINPIWNPLHFAQIVRLGLLQSQHLQRYIPIEDWQEQYLFLLD